MVESANRPAWNKTVTGQWNQVFGTQESCQRKLPDNPWKDYFCKVAATYYGGRSTYAKFDPSKRNMGRADERRSLTPEQTKAQPFRLEVKSLLFMRDVDGDPLNGDITMPGDLDALFGNVALRMKMLHRDTNQNGSIDVAKWRNTTQGFNNIHVIVVDMTELGAELFDQRNRIPHEGMEYWYDGVTSFEYVMDDMWSLQPYSPFPQGADILRWNTGVRSTERAPRQDGRNGAAWQRSYAADKLIKGMLNLAVADAIADKDTQAFSAGIEAGKFNHTLIPGPVLSNNGKETKFEFGSMRDFGTQWLEYGAGYVLLGLKPDHDYALVVFESDSGRKLHRKFEIREELRMDPDDVIAIGMIRANQIQDGAKFVFYERPRVQIGKDGREKIFPPAGVVTFNVKQNKRSK